MGEVHIGAWRPLFQTLSDPHVVGLLGWSLLPCESLIRPHSAPELADQQLACWRAKNQANIDGWKPQGRFSKCGVRNPGFDCGCFATIPQHSTSASHVTREVGSSKFAKRKAEKPSGLGPNCPPQFSPGRVESGVHQFGCAQVSMSATVQFKELHHREKCTSTG